MRDLFATQVEQALMENKQLVFLTADLGFNALEKLQKSGKERFINAGIAEQNMIGVAAGLAYMGHPTFVYNIASFGVYRSFEQFKLDVCLQNLPVYLVGNGGGYGYGVMGATHHAIEDLACLSALPNVQCWIPAFQEDIEFCLRQIMLQKKPAYLRLGMGISYTPTHPISSINLIAKAEQPSVTVVALGPLVKNALEAIADTNDIDLFTVLTIPLPELSLELLQSIATTKKMMVLQEHVERGGMGEHLLSFLAKKSILLTNFVSLHAQGYPSNTYGDSSFHQQESGLDTDNIRKELRKLIEN
jgi:transketolase